MLTMLARDNTPVSELLALLIVGKYYYVNCVKFMTYRQLYQFPIREAFVCFSLSSIKINLSIVLTDIIFSIVLIPFGYQFKQLSDGINFNIVHNFIQRWYQHLSMELLSVQNSTSILCQAQFCERICISDAYVRQCECCKFAKLHVGLHEV